VNGSGYPDVAIVGIGHTRPSPERLDVDYSELAYEAIAMALEDAGAELADVEHAVTAALDFVDGRTIASMSTAEVVNSYLKPEARLCGDGINAVLYAWAKMRVGTYRIGLVLAHAKESQGRQPDIENAAFDPFTSRRLGADGDVVAALAAQRFYAATGVTPEDAAGAVVRARRAGATNPRLDPPGETTVEEVLTSAPLSTPLRALDKAPLGDAAVALVLATGDAATGLGTTPVWIRGAAVCTGGYFDTRDLASIEALEDAKAKTDRLAGWDGTAADLVEMSAQYGFQVPQFAPAFGLAPDDERLTPSGGWLAAGSQVTSGLYRTAEAAHQLRGTAGAVQRTDARRAYASGFHGLGAQTHAVIALEADA
jgi:acetyl-CoA C-acetyltransferase